LSSTIGDEELVEEASAAVVLEHSPQQLEVHFGSDTLLCLNATSQGEQSLPQDRFQGQHGEAKRIVVNILNEKVEAVCAGDSKWHCCTRDHLLHRQRQRKHSTTARHSSNLLPDSGDTFMCKQSNTEFQSVL
jgi:hypothetical protein